MYNLYAVLDQYSLNYTTYTVYVMSSVSGCICI